MVVCREAARHLEAAKAELVQSRAELKRAQNELQEAGKPFPYCSLSSGSHCEILWYLSMGLASALVVLAHHFLDLAMPQA